MPQHSFFGYRRENGRVGIRNHVVILPLDDLSNASAEAVAKGDASSAERVLRDEVTKAAAEVMRLLMKKDVGQ